MYRSHIENPRVDGSIPPLATIFISFRKEACKQLQASFAFRTVCAT
jgi:hypothetical protein